MKNSIILPVFSAAALLAMAASHSHAATAGTDNASQSAYINGWTNGTDGAVTGDGFSSWYLVNSTNGAGAASGFFIGDSKNLSSGQTGADIDTNSKAFGMYAGLNGSTDPNPAASADAYRWFVQADGTTHDTLAVGQTFSLNIAVNYRNGFKGIDLRDASDSTIFNFNIGNNDYVVSNATTGNGSIGNSYDANTSFGLAFTQTSLTGGTWAITRGGGTASNASGTYSGAAGSFKLYVGQTDGGSQNDLYANNMAVVPEPTTLGMMAGAGVALAAASLRRRRSS